MLSGLILAGGRSERMGRDKAELQLADGQTLLQRQVAVLREAGASAVYVSVRAESEFKLNGVELVRDFLPDAGPLAGIAAGLRAAPAGLVLVLAVDMPAITTEQLGRLLELATPQQGVVPTVAGQIEPLVAIYPASLAVSAEAWLTGGQSAVHAWVRSEADKGTLRLWETPAEWAGAFRSWNTPADAADGSARL